jgi:uncharacterized protein YdhG (YjbR/CyaY superfamily)
MPTFDEYFAGLAEPQRAALERVRLFVRRVAPDAEESESYGMPAFRYRGRPLLGVNAASNHLSVFPFSPGAIDAARDELAGFELSKGTVRFTPERPIPARALRLLVRTRLQEIKGAGAAPEPPGSTEGRC